MAQTWYIFPFFICLKIQKSQILKVANILFKFSFSDIPFNGCDSYLLAIQNKMAKSIILPYSSIIFMNYWCLTYLWSLGYIPGSQLSSESCSLLI